MRKLALAQVAYQDDFLILYPIYMITGSVHLRVHFMSIKYTCESKLQTLRMRYPFQSTGRPISHRNVWLFCVYMIPLQDFVLE